MSVPSSWSDDSDVFDDSQFSLTSWITKHNSTVSGQSPSIPDFSDSQAVDEMQLPDSIDRLIDREHTRACRPLSVEGQKLRSECLTGSGVPCNWSEAVTQWRLWLDGYDGGSLVFEDDEGERITRPAEVRFGDKRSRREYAKIHNLRRGLRDEWGDLLHVAFLTFTASSRNARGGYRCPADHLNDLKSSSGAILSALHRSLEGRDYEFCWVHEPHKSGYVHRHLAVFVRGSVSEEDFHPVIDAHLRNCPSAGRAAHDYTAEDEKERPITCKRVSDREGDINNIAYYMAEYVSDSFGGYDEETPEHVEMFNALLWATETQRVDYSQGSRSDDDRRKGASHYIEKGYEIATGNEYREESTDLTLIGFTAEGDAEVYEIDLEDTDRATLERSKSLCPDLLDPPPDDSTEAVDEGTEPET